MWRVFGCQKSFTDMCLNGPFNLVLLLLLLQESVVLSCPPVHWGHRKNPKMKVSGVMRHTADAGAPNLLGPCVTLVCIVN